MPRSFRLLLRSADDLQLLAPPPRWTLERVVWIFAGVSLVSLLAAAAVLLVARRRLREQAARRALAEAEFTAILKERSRVAREIHDTLAQGLTAISMQLELARNDLKANAGGLGLRLEEAHRLVRHALAEARNSIWNMRSHVLENGDLPAALQGILRQLTEGSKVESACEVTGRVRRLPAVAENNLLRIGQEALTNATKHAGARHVWLRLEFTDKHVCLSVRDDGCGFTLESQPGEKRGFGLLGMRERAAQMHAEFAVRSQPGHGTEILVTVPTTG